MTHYVRVCPLAGIPADRGRPVFVDGKVIAIFRVGHQVYALDDSCPHNGSSLAAGRQDGVIIACRAHGLRFDIRTGRMRGVDGTVEVDIVNLTPTATDGAVAVDVAIGALCPTKQATPG